MGDFRAFVSEVKSKTPIEAIVGEVVDLKSKNNSLWGPCPFHNEKTPSFHVYPSRGMFHCFGCQEGGDVVAFVQKFNGLDFWSAVTRLARAAGVEVPTTKDKLPEEIAADRVRASRRRTLYQTLGAAVEYWASQMTSRARSFALDRWGIVDATLIAHRIGYASGRGLAQHMQGLGYSSDDLLAAGLLRRKEGQLFEVFRDRLIAPFIREGEVVYLTGRDLSGNERAPKYFKLPKQSDAFPDVDPMIGEEGVLLYDALVAPRHRGPVIVCEGTFDGYAVWQAGFPVVALQTAAASPSARKDLLKIGRRRGLILCFDTDEAGQRGAIALASDMHRSRVDVRVALLPSINDVKIDVAAFLRDGNDLAPLIESAPSLPEVKLSLASPSLTGADLESYLKDLSLDLCTSTLADRDRLTRQAAAALGLARKTVEGYVREAEKESSYKPLPLTTPTPAEAGTLKNLPTVEIGVDSEALVDVAERLLPSLGVPVFAYGGALVTIHAPPLDGPASGLVLPRPLRLTQPRLSTLLDSAAYWVKPRGREKAFVSCPDKIIASLHDRGNWGTVAPLLGIVTTPYLRADGSLSLTPGYDDSTGLFLAPIVEGINPSDQPTIAQEKEALRDLLDVVQDFDFATPACRAAWLALPLTLLARPAIEGNTPGIMFDANTRGAGKTLLAELGATIGTGAIKPFKRNYPHDDDEMQKSLLAIARGSRRFVLFDECKTLGGDSINMAMTSTSYAGRVLGVSEDVTLPFFSVLCFTGNNVKLIGDVDRRLLSVRLLSSDERPENRGNFAISDVEVHVRENRARLATAGLTLLRAAALSGRSHDLAPWQSYLSWSKVIRGTIARYIKLSQGWGPKYELADPAGARPTPDDLPDTLYQKMLIDAVAAAVTSQGMTAAAIVDYAYRYSEGSSASSTPSKLREAIEYLTGTQAGKRPTVRAAGNLFARLRDRNLGGYKLVGLKKTGEGVPWVVQEVKAK